MNKPLPPTFPFIASSLVRRSLLAGIALSPALTALPALAQFRVEVSGVGLTQLPIALVAVLFGIVFTAVDFAVVYILTHGGPFNSTQVLPTWAYAIGIDSGSLGEGAAISLFLFPLLVLVTVGMLFFARRAQVS